LGKKTLGFFSEEREKGCVEKSERKRRVRVKKEKKVRNGGPQNITQGQRPITKRGNLLIQTGGYKRG